MKHILCIFARLERGVSPRVEAILLSAGFGAVSWYDGSPRSVLIGSLIEGDHGLL